MFNSSSRLHNLERRRLISYCLKAGAGIIIGSSLIANAVDVTAKLGIPDRIRSGPYTGIRGETAEVPDDRDLICWEIGSSKYGNTIENPVVKTGPFAGTKVKVYDKRYKGNYVDITFEDPNKIKQQNLQI